jgi:hypothetical protein
MQLTAAALLPLAALLFSPAQAGLATRYLREKCVHSRTEEFAQGSSCGDKAWLQTCLAQVPGAASELKFCFVHAGCSDILAEYEAGLILEQCHVSTDDDVELRRRGLEALPSKISPRTGLWAKHLALQEDETANSETLQ